VYPSKQLLETDPASYITPNDIERSRTLNALPELTKILGLLKGKVGRERMLDVGCGFGGLSLFIGQKLGIGRIYGVDIDRRALREARSKGVLTSVCDVSDHALPFVASQFDLVSSFGMLDYLPFYDNALAAMIYTLKPGGYILISLPNLASWHNRLALLLGYQPRDVEVSQRLVVGVHRHYRDQAPTGHIHTVTTRGFEQLAENLALRTVHVSGVSPAQLRGRPLLGALDRLIARRPTLANRFVYVGQKPGAARSS
jgi:SAM-dependent methyltransferase